MDITIHSSFLPHTDAEASLAFYRDVLGFEVRLDVGYEVSDDEKQTLLELVAKGSYFGVNLATDDLDATFAAIEAAGADIVQEPIDQDYGIRDAAVRDPAGNLIRIQQNRGADGAPTEKGH